MKLSDLLKKSSDVTMTVATLVTVDEKTCPKVPSVATVASVNVATTEKTDCEPFWWHVQDAEGKHHFLPS